MRIERDLSIRVNKGYSVTKNFYLDDDVTILTKDDIVLEGRIVAIQSKGLAIEDKKIGVVMVLYMDIENIVDTDWLCGGDIRED